MKFTEKELDILKREKMKEIDKWLDNEYGCSYTRLEELHDFVVEQDLKHREEKDKEIERLNKILNDIDTYIHLWKIDDIGEKTMLILNDILLIKNGMSNEVVRLKAVNKE